MKNRRSNLTYLSGGIDKAYKSIEKFSVTDHGKRNPTMIVLLTDGNPNKGIVWESIPYQSSKAIYKTFLKQPSMLLAWEKQIG